MSVKLCLTKCMIGLEKLEYVGSFEHMKRHSKYIAALNDIEEPLHILREFYIKHGSKRQFIFEIIWDYLNGFEHCIDKIDKLDADQLNFMREVLNYLYIDINSTLYLKYLQVKCNSIPFFAQYPCLEQIENQPDWLNLAACPNLNTLKCLFTLAHYAHSFGVVINYQTNSILFEDVGDEQWYYASMYEPLSIDLIIQLKLNKPLWTSSIVKLTIQSSVFREHRFINFFPQFEVVFSTINPNGVTLLDYYTLLARCNPDKGDEFCKLTVKSTRTNGFEIILCVEFKI